MTPCGVSLCIPLTSGVILGVHACCLVRGCSDSTQAGAAVPVGGYYAAVKRRLLKGPVAIPVAAVLGGLGAIAGIGLNGHRLEKKRFVCQP